MQASLDLAEQATKSLEEVQVAMTPISGKAIYERCVPVETTSDAVYVEDTTVIEGIQDILRILTLFQSERIIEHNLWDNDEDRARLELLVHANKNIQEIKHMLV